mmetsp:Transcript_138450/g.350940  ORF Transcript_138450/g.350940 Transcript_138450/m.350940 type:complete len:209 (-) Transcript_138450:460-1086(-)
MAGQAHHAHIMREVLAAELRANLQVLADLQHLLLPLEVPESTAMGISGCGQIVVVPRARQLYCLQAQLCGGAPDDQGDVVGWASAGAQGLHLLFDEGFHLLLVEKRLGLLKEVRLVRRAATLRHEHELVGASLRGKEVDLRGQIGFRVLLVEHRHGGDLRVSQVPPCVRLVNTPRDVGLIIAVCKHVLAALTHANGGARVLASWQDTF